MFTTEAKMVARKKAARPMTTARKNAIGQRKGANGTADAFYDVDAFTTMFPDFDLLSRVLYDIAHGLGNNIANLFAMALNTGQFNYNNTRRMYEQVTLQRYEDYKKQERMPWFICPRALAKLKVLETKRCLQVPTSWEPMFDMFTTGVPGKVHKYTSFIVCIYVYALYIYIYYTSNSLFVLSSYFIRTYNSYFIRTYNSYFILALI
jgi:hypothetical protein